jgi:hypothetical protein
MFSGSLDHLTFSVSGSAVLSANVGYEISLELPLVVLLHFIERIAGGRPRRIEHPCAFGAAPAPKTLFVDPNQFAAHGLPSTPRDWVRLCSCERRRGIAFFELDCDGKSRFALGEILHNSPLFEHASKPT